MAVKLMMHTLCCRYHGQVLGCALWRVVVLFHDAEDEPLHRADTFLELQLLLDLKVCISPLFRMTLDGLGSRLDLCAIDTHGRTYMLLIALISLEQHLI